MESTGRQDIDNLLIDKISDALNVDQKRTKIKNLLFEMSHKDKRIKNIGTKKKPTWVLA